jgi:hypothetical protein
MTQKTPTETEKNIEKASSELKIGFEERLEKMFNELVDKRFGELEKRLDKSIEDKLAAMEVETERVLRKSFGLPQGDRPVMLSEVASVLRKAQLENSDSGKKTPAPDKLEKSNPDGTAQKDAIDQIFAPLGGN